MKRILSLSGICVVLLTMVACGGGGGTPPPTPTPVIPITITPSSAVVPIGGSQSFVASVAGVTWSVSGPGSINAAGLYLAPTTFPAGANANAVTVTATAGAQTGHATGTVVFPNDNQGNQTAPVKLGTSGGNILDNNTAGTLCCIGTLGSLLQRGTTLFILSNNHVLARSSQGVAGEAIDQPGQPRCPSGSQGLNVANLSEQAALKPSPCTGVCTGNAPSNVDAAIAQIVGTTVDTTGSILDLGPAGSTSIAAAPPSNTPIDAATALTGHPKVAKSGRTTGLTCSTLQSVSTDNISVAYDTSCGGTTAFNAIFNGQIVIAGGTFSAGGDSGSLIVTADTVQPLGLLYAGSPTNTVANTILDSTNSQGVATKGVLSAFNNGTAPTIVGTASPTPVSCLPTAQAASTAVGAQSTPVSVQKQQIAAGVRNRHAAELMSSEPAIRAVKAGASSDAPGEGALVIELSAVPQGRIPAVIEGVRTKLVYAEGVAAPSTITSDEFNRGLVAKDDHRSEYMQPGFQGIGVGVSNDAPGEAAVVVYTIKGQTHAAVPAVINGVRTKVIEDEPFRAFGWNSHLEPKGGACSKAQPQALVKTGLK